MNPVAVITERLSVYQQALVVAREEGDMQKVATFQANIMVLPKEKCVISFIPSAIKLNLLACTQSIHLTITLFSL